MAERMMTMDAHSEDAPMYLLGVFIIVFTILPITVMIYGVWMDSSYIPFIGIGATVLWLFILRIIGMGDDRLEGGR